MNAQSNKVLVSHSTKNADLADLLSSLIRKCSLQQITPWYSSDRSGNGGIQAGERWFEKIRSELAASRSVLVLLTPESLESAWVHFEAGFGAANGDLEIIPVVFGLSDLSLVPNPITHWQIFRADQYDDCLKFLEKLFSQFGVHFDPDISAEPIRKFIKEADKKASKETSKLPTEKDDFARLRDYLDKKLFDITRKISSEETNFSGYEFEIENRVSFRDIRVHIDIHTSFADILNDVYFKIEDEVEAYTYLEEWILKDEDTGQRFILREVASEIKASDLLKPGRWVVAERLSAPYSGSDSDDVSEYNGGFSASSLKKSEM